MKDLVIFNDWEVKYQGQGFITLIIGTAIRFNKSFIVTVAMEKDVYLNLNIGIYKYSIFKENEEMWIYDLNKNVIKYIRFKYL